MLNPAVLNLAMSSARRLLAAVARGATLGVVARSAPVVLIALAACGGAAHAAALPDLVPGKAVHFQDSPWNAAPQVGPNGKVRQCVLIALRKRAVGSRTVETKLSLNISAGAGLVFKLSDDQLPTDVVLDDEGEIIIHGHSFPAVAFTIANASDIAIHPGDAAGLLAALKTTTAVRLRSDGAGIDTGVMVLDLPGEALAWLEQCGKKFDIPIDKPSDPDAAALPLPRPRSPEIASAQPTAAGPPGIEDKQRISGWDASELRTPDGRIGVCLIRRHYAASDAPDASRFASFLMVSRTGGLFMMLKDPKLNLPGEPGFAATLTVGDKPFTAFSAHMLGSDEIGIFPADGAALEAALGDGVDVSFKSSIDSMGFPVLAGVVPWLRACARRNGIAFEAPGKSEH